MTIPTYPEVLRTLLPLHRRALQDHALIVRAKALTWRPAIGPVAEALARDCTDIAAALEKHEAPTLDKLSNRAQVLILEGLLHLAKVPHPLRLAILAQAYAEGPLAGEGQLLTSVHCNAEALLRGLSPEELAREHRAEMARRTGHAPKA